MICRNTVYTGPRAGQECGYRTSVAIATRAYTEQVCGYHARQYTPDVQYPLDWNLTRIRAWRLDNVNRLRFDDSLCGECGHDENEHVHYCSHDEVTGSCDCNAEYVRKVD